MCYRYRSKFSLLHRHIDVFRRWILRSELPGRNFKSNIFLNITYKNFSLFLNLRNSYGINNPNPCFRELLRELRHKVLHLMLHCNLSPQKVYRDIFFSFCALCWVVTSAVSKASQIWEPSCMHFSIANNNVDIFINYTLNE